MSLTLAGNMSAMAPGLETYFGASGGMEPYVYSVLAGGAGGTINSVSGLYEAPSVQNPDPSKSFDIVQVIDDNGDTATQPILIVGALGLFCEIIEREMNLSNGRVYLYNQKIMQPTDSGLYVAVSVLNCKPFANTITQDTSGAGIDAIQSINMLATLTIDAISRSTEALMRKEEILMALASQYSESQQEANSFFIGKLPPGGQFVNLSNIDGAAIPYRFNISVNIQYFARKTKAVPYFDEFADASVVTKP